VTEVPSPGGELADAVQAFRRVLRRAVRSSFPDPPLPPSEAELLALVGRDPDVSVNEAAGVMQLAPNSVSTLVGRLVALGLLERRVDPDDRRAARLRLTVAGDARVQAWRRHRDGVVRGAVDRLSVADRRALATALPVLRRLSAALEAEEARPPVEDSGGDPRPGRRAS
jgi:DNA-binding MarR family transcriptional regulator